MSPVPIRLAFVLLLAAGGAKEPPKKKPAPAPAAHRCASSDACKKGEYCTTEDGACDRPPGCGPNDTCPSVCYGVCKKRK